MDKNKIKETLEKQLQLLSEAFRRNKKSGLYGTCETIRVYVLAGRDYQSDLSERSVKRF